MDKFLAIMTGCGLVMAAFLVYFMFFYDARDAYVFGTWVNCEVLFGPPERECRINAAGDKTIEVRRKVNP